MERTERVEVIPAREAGPQSASTQPADEINLVDLARLIWRHWQIAALTLGMIVAFGFIVALLTPKKYAYTTAIEIGSLVEDGKTLPIEAPDTVLAKLENGYIPQARLSYADDHPEDTDQYRVVVRLPNNSQLVVMESRAVADQGATYQQIHRQVVDALVTDHARVYDTARREIELDRKQAERELQGLADRHIALTRQLERTKTAHRLLERQIAETSALIEVNTKNRDRAVAEARDEARAMTLLMLDNEVRANRAHLATLERELTIQLETTRDDLRNRLLDNQRAQELKKAQIERITLQLKNLRETRTVNLAARSLRAVGTGRSTIVLVSAVLGLLAALIVPLLLDFFSRVKNGAPPPSNADKTAVSAPSVP